jgi:NADH kinase
VDGREVCSLSSGESVIIKKSPFPIPCVVRGEGGGGWARDIKSVPRSDMSDVS